MDANIIIEEKPAFTLIGIGRDFSKDDSFNKIPEFWDEFLSLDRQPIKGRFGVCIDKDNSIRYLIADIFYPWESVPRSLEPITFEAGMWAMFSADGPLPDSLQKVTSFVWKEWVPGNKEYDLRVDYSIEFYPHDVRDSEYTHSEIWLPVRKK